MTWRDFWELYAAGLLGALVTRLLFPPSDRSGSSSR